MNRKPKTGACGSSDCKCHRKPRLFGPGTLVMLAAVAVIIAVGYVKSEPLRPLVSNLPAPTRPLSKPEPASILGREDLHLTQSQHLALGQVVTEWGRIKDRLTQAMSAYQPKQGRVDQISVSLSGYTELSRSYDSQRSLHWEKAVALLDKRQRDLLARGSK